MQAYTSEMKALFDEHFGIIFPEMVDYIDYISMLTDDCRIVTLFTMYKTAADYADEIPDEEHREYLEELDWKIRGWSSKEFKEFPLVQAREGYYIDIQKPPKLIDRIRVENIT